MRAKCLGITALAFLAGAAAVSMVSVAAESASKSSNKDSNSFAIRHVDVFDGKTVKRGEDVIVKDGLIEAVGTRLPIPPGLAVTDGAGKMLLPGLIDAHVHSWLSSRSDALRFGVTTELDMFMDWHALADARAQRQSLVQTSKSDLWSSGTLATAAGGHGTEYGLKIPTLSEPGQAQAWVDARVAEGSDYIKIIIEPGSAKHPLPTLSPPIVSALVSAAHHDGKMAVAHVQNLESARIAVSAGVDVLAHVFWDQPADDAFIQAVRHKHVLVIPTLTVYSTAVCGPIAASLAKDPAVAPHLGKAQQDMLLAHDEDCSGNYLEMATANVRRLHQAGIPLLAGTDAGNPGAAHGVSLLGELELLVKAGLTPVEALAAATSGPAQRFGLKDRGRIERGQRADLLLVEGDPARDPAMLRHIAAIWMNGYPVNRDPSSQPEEPQSFAMKYQQLYQQVPGQPPEHKAATYTGQLNMAGSLEVKLAGDEPFKGPYQPVSPGEAPQGLAADLAKDWDMIDGAGYYEQHVKASSLYVRSLIVSGAGTSLATEIILDGKDGYTGVARDSRGNIYKVSFDE